MGKRVEKADEWDNLIDITMETLIKLEEVTSKNKVGIGNVCKAWEEQKKAGIIEGKVLVAQNLIRETKMLDGEIQFVTELPIEQIIEIRRIVQKTKKIDEKE